MAALPDHLMPVPVGKSRLSREVLEEHQRRRVLAAAAPVFAGDGYRATTVDRLVRAAGIGVGSFYALFSGKEECFLALFDDVVEEGRAAIGAAVDASAPWADRTVAGLRALLDRIAAEPDRARVAIVEANTAGAAGERRYAAVLAELTAALRAGRAAPERVGEEPPESFEDAAVGGLAWILHQRLAAGEPVVAGELLPEMASIVVGPYKPS